MALPVGSSPPAPTNPIPIVPSGSNTEEVVENEVEVGEVVDTEISTNEGRKKYFDTLTVVRNILVDKDEKDSYTQDDANEFADQIDFLRNVSSDMGKEPYVLDPENVGNKAKLDAFLAPILTQEVQNNNFKFTPTSLENIKGQKDFDRMAIANKTNELLAIASGTGYGHRCTQFDQCDHGRFQCSSLKFYETKKKFRRSSQFNHRNGERFG